MRRTLVLLSALLVVASCGDDDLTNQTGTMPADTTRVAAAPAATTTTMAPTTITEPSTVASTTTTTTTTTMPPLPPFEPTDVSFAIEIDKFVGQGTFLASGSAVDAGLMCPQGTLFEASFDHTSGTSGRDQEWEYRFECADGSGRFSIAVIDLGEWTEGFLSDWAYSGTWTWVETMGLSAYEGISGEGVEDGLCLQVDPWAPDPPQRPATDCTEEYTGQITRNG